MPQAIVEKSVNGKYPIGLRYTTPDLASDEGISAVTATITPGSGDPDLETSGAVSIDSGVRELVRPPMERWYKFMKSKMNAKLFLHSCGSIYQFIPDLIEMGVDIINPVQVSAKDMDTARLKKEFGSEIVFWGGGCDTQTVLPHGTPNDVREEVKRRMGDLAPGGGFVFNQVHNIQPGVPPENIVAMFEAALEFAAY